LAMGEIVVIWRPGWAVERRRQRRKRGVGGVCMGATHVHTLSLCNDRPIVLCFRRMICSFDQTLQGQADDSG
jgi:hypothetical protein